MTGAPGDRLKGGIKGDNARRERLAAELRANLKRRKAQARAAADAEGRDGTDAPVSPADESLRKT